MTTVKTIEQIQADYQEDILAGYKALLSEKARYEQIMSSMGMSYRVDDSQKTDHSGLSNHSDDKKLTFDKIVTNALEMNKTPLRTIEIAELIKGHTGKDHDRKNIASRMSIGATKNKFLKFEYGIKDPSLNFWWTLPQWWAGDGKLHPRYFESIERRIKEIANE